MAGFGSVSLEALFADLSNVEQLRAAIASERAERAAAARARSLARMALISAALPVAGSDGGDAGERDPFAEAEAEQQLAEELAAGAAPAGEAGRKATMERAEERRALGNELFGRSRWADAAEAYSQALRLLSSSSAPDNSGSDHAAARAGDLEDATEDEPRRALRAALLCNRAAALLRLGRHEEARADCDGVLRAGRADALSVKALFRRAKAHEGLGDADAAEADLRRVVELEPHNAAAKEELEAFRSIFHRIAVLANARGRGAAARRR